MDTERLSWTQVFPGSFSFSRFIDCDRAEEFWGARTIWIASYNGSNISRSWMIVAWED